MADPVRIFLKKNSIPYSAVYLCLHFSQTRVAAEAPQLPASLLPGYIPTPPVPDASSNLNIPSSSSAGRPRSPSAPSNRAPSPNTPPGAQHARSPSAPSGWGPPSPDAPPSPNAGVGRRSRQPSESRPRAPSDSRPHAPPDSRSRARLNEPHPSQGHARVPSAPLDAAQSTTPTQHRPRGPVTTQPAPTRAPVPWGQEPDTGYPPRRPASRAASSISSFDKPRTSMFPPHLVPPHDF
jgi:hypothetical protein